MHMSDFCFSLRIWDVEMLSIFGITVTPCCRGFQTRGRLDRMCAFFSQLRREEETTVPRPSRRAKEVEATSSVGEPGISRMLQRVSNMTRERAEVFWSRDAKREKSMGRQTQYADVVFKHTLTCSPNKQQPHLFPSLRLFV